MYLRETVTMLEIFRKSCRHQKGGVGRLKYNEDGMLGRMFGLLIGSILETDENCSLNVYMDW